MRKDPEIIYLVFSPRRNGHHAIINWACRQMSYVGKATHYNNINYPEFKEGPIKGDTVLDYINGSVAKAQRFGRFVELRVKDRSRVRVFNFEDRMISNYSRFVEGSKYLPPKSKVRCVMVLRDPYNAFASHLHSRSCEEFDHFVRCWKEIAREFLGETSFLPPDTVKILYNRWTKDPEYRKEKALELGIEHFTDEGYNEVVSFGHGSSFDFMSKVNQASEMDIEGRWKLMYRDRKYQSSLDEDVHRMSRALFGFDLETLTLGCDDITRTNVFISMRHPLEEGLNKETSAKRCDDFAEWLRTSPAGDISAQKIEPDSSMKLVSNWQHVFENRFQGRGIVIVAGGGKYLPLAWINVSRLRALGCNLPIQIWHKTYQWGTEAPPHYVAPFLKKFEDVVFINAAHVRTQIPCRRLGGWELKPYAITNCNFREVLFLDADNLAMVNPEILFESDGYRETGALFWPDRGRYGNRNPIFDLTNTEWIPKEEEWESGQIVVDKARHWRALQFTMWMNENSDFFYNQFHGDKETFKFGWKKMGSPFVIHPPMKDLTGWDCICQHDMEGNRIFQHRSGKKYGFSAPNEPIKGFLDHEIFVEYLLEYREKVLEGGAFVP